jgi:hypothetical protein
MQKKISCTPHILLELVLANAKTSTLVEKGEDKATFLTGKLDYALLALLHTPEELAVYLGGDVEELNCSRWLLMPSSSGQLILN